MEQTASLDAILESAKAVNKEAFKKTLEAITKTESYEGVSPALKELMNVLRKEDYTAFNEKFVNFLAEEKDLDVLKVLAELLKANKELLINSTWAPISNTVHRIIERADTKIAVAVINKQASQETLSDHDFLQVMSSLSLIAFERDGRAAQNNGNYNWTSEMTVEFKRQRDEVQKLLKDGEPSPEAKEAVRAFLDNYSLAFKQTFSETVFRKLQSFFLPAPKGEQKAQVAEEETIEALVARRDKLQKEFSSSPSSMNILRDLQTVEQRLLNHLSDKVMSMGAGEREAMALRPSERANIFESIENYQAKTSNVMKESSSLSFQVWSGVCSVFQSFMSRMAVLSRASEEGAAKCNKRESKQQLEPPTIEPELWQEEEGLEKYRVLKNTILKARQQDCERFLDDYLRARAEHYCLRDALLPSGEKEKRERFISELKKAIANYTSESSDVADRDILITKLSEGEHHFSSTRTKGSLEEVIKKVRDRLDIHAQDRRVTPAMFDMKKRIKALHQDLDKGQNEGEGEGGKPPHL